MGEAQAAKVGRLEPRDRVMFGRRGVDGCSGPPVDQPDLRVDRRGPDLMHRWAGRHRRRDPQFLPKLADQALLRHIRGRLSGRCGWDERAGVRGAVAPRGEDRIDQVGAPATQPKAAAHAME